MKRGKASVREISVRLFTPVKPMLAHIADSVEDIFKEYERFALEYKLDGVRVQVHKQHDTVKIYSRHLKDITVHFPEVVEAAQQMKVQECILDGEAIGVDSRGRPLPFQTLAKRTTRKKDIETMRKKIHVVPQFFDILYCNGEDTTKLPYEERWQLMTGMIPDANKLTPRVIPVNKALGIKFYTAALEKGSEGVMAKLLDTPYKAGKRGKIWFKIKRSHTIDCVILAAEWGSGRRTGWLSNLHLGVLDETRAKYLMVGKTFKGMTDTMLRWFTEHLQRIKVHEDKWYLMVGKTFKGMTDTMLRWFTEHLQRIKVHEDKWTVYVKPEVVVEIVFNNVQQSTRYDSGVALRFARVKAIRKDKKPEDINTIADLHVLSEATRGTA
jgi:DNA ligase-1